MTTPGLLAATQLSYPRVPAGATPGVTPEVPKKHTGPKLPFKFKVPDDPTRLLAAYCGPVDPTPWGSSGVLRPLGPSSHASEPRPCADPPALRLLSESVGADPPSHTGPLRLAVACQWQGRPEGESGPPGSRGNMGTGASAVGLYPLSHHAGCTVTRMLCQASRPHENGMSSLNP
jgi:hypothetical protein